MTQADLLLLMASLAALFVVLAAFVFFLVLGRIWLKAFLSGAPVTIFSLLGMLLRGTPRSLLVDAYIQLRHRGSAATIREVEAQYLAECHRIRTPGDLVDLVELRFQEAAAADRRSGQPPSGRR